MGQTGLAEAEQSSATTHGINNRMAVLYRGQGGRKIQRLDKAVVILHLFIRLSPSRDHLCIYVSVFILFITCSMEATSCLETPPTRPIYKRETASTGRGVEEKRSKYSEEKRNGSCLMKADRGEARRGEGPCEGALSSFVLLLFERDPKWSRGLKDRSNNVRSAKNR